MSDFQKWNLYPIILPDIIQFYFRARAKLFPPLDISIFERMLQLAWKVISALFIVENTCGNVLHKNLFQDGTCLLFGNFLNKNSTIDYELYNDQVMILINTWHTLDHLREYVSVKMLISSNFKMQFFDGVYAFQGFVEDTIKTADCVILVHGSTVIPGLKGFITRQVS